MSNTSAPPLIIGWREWAVLPELGLHGIKAKVDTGATTSALHAFAIETFHERGRWKVRFQIHPFRKKDLIVTCVTNIIDERTITDSGGHRERRLVIETTLVLGEYEQCIEVTLCNRETLTHRMLLGRSAMHGTMIDPDASFLLGKPKDVMRRYRKKDRPL